ncbi:hypothetical protein [Peribacillus asahii]|uniref:hypothetical protein n=1 Tax=Peribacillus asahii TaxID=228899 RepID=UPI00207ADE99|nr:hypothetical protein [Peribacillus asahii]USK62320.1 hypothetical protein LIT37_24410 [Peribacillus asahii]
MDKKKIVLGSSNVGFAKAIRNEIDKTSEYVVADTSVSEVDLIEYLETHPSEIYGIIITSDLAKKLNEKRLEYLADVLITLREKHAFLKIIVLSHEKVGHPFLAELVNMGIYNVFVLGEDGKAITTERLLECLENGRSFSEVSKYRDFDKLIEWRRISNGPQSITIDNKGHSSHHTINKEDSVKQPKEPRVKVKEKIVEKEKVIIEEKLISFSNSSIGVLSLSSGAGATFLSILMAQAISERNITCSLLEYPYSPKGTTMLYDQMYLEQEYMETPFYSIPKIIKEEGIVDKNQIHQVEHLSVLAAGREPIEEWSFENHLHYLHSQKSNVMIMDLGSRKNCDKHDEMINKIIQQLDHCFIVVDPLPHLLLANEERFIELLELYEERENIHFIFNKWSKEASKLIPANLPLNLKEALKVPYIERELLYKGYAKFQQPYQQKEVKEKVNPFIEDLLKIVSPDFKIPRTLNLWNRLLKKS